VEAGRFERVREGLARKYRNANMRPEQAAGYMRLLVLRATVWHVDAVLAVLDSLTPADVQVGDSALRRVRTCMLSLDLSWTLTAHDAVNQRLRQLSPFVPLWALAIRYIIDCHLWSLTCTWL